MTNNHLSDEILQGYLLKDIQNDTIAIHLSECSTCQKRLEDYQFLIGNLQKIETETFSFDITTLAMDSVMLYEKKRKKQELIFWGFLIVLFIIIASSSIPYIPQILAVFYSQSILTTLFIIVTTLVVFLFLLADVYREYKKKEEKLFKNNLQPII